MRHDGKSAYWLWRQEVVTKSCGMEGRQTLIRLALLPLRAPLYAFHCTHSVERSGVIHRGSNSGVLHARVLRHLMVMRGIHSTQFGVCILT